MYMLFLLLGFHLAIIYSQISSISLIPAASNPVLPMYQNSQVQSNFNNNQIRFSCSLPNTYIYEQTLQELNANTPYYLKIIGEGQHSIIYSTTYNTFQPTISPVLCSDNCTIAITNNCPIHLNSQNYFDILNIQVDSLPVMSYRINCDISQKHYQFQWGLVILIVGMTLLIFTSSSFSQSVAFDGFGITLNYYILAGTCIIIPLIGILGIFYMKPINTLAQVISWILGIICVSTCINEILVLCSIKILNKPLLTMKQKQFKYFRGTQVISIIIGISITSAWYFTYKNWIINDILSCCIIIASVQFLKFTSFRMVTFYYTCIIVIEVVVAVVLYYHSNQSYDTVILNNFNNPLEMQFPSITKSLNYKCSWLPITEIIFPAISISYVRRFDHSKSYRVYLIISIVAFFCGCTAWALIDLFTFFPVPLGLLVEGTVIVSVLLFSLQRNQRKVIWNGQFYDVQYNHLKQLKKQMRNRRDSQSQKVEIQLIRYSSIVQGLKIDERQSSLYHRNTRNSLGQRENNNNL